MTNMRNLSIALFLFLVIGTAFFESSFEHSTDTFFYKIRSAFALPTLAIRNLFENHNFASALNDLQLENQSLRAELLAATIGAPKIEGGLYPAKVSASYPYNNKSALTITGGASDGIAVGMTVLVVKGIFLGQISKVGKNWSEVRTAFDNSKELSVRVGASGVAALLRGGVSLTAGLIDKIKIVNVGDAVYTAAKDIPYGLKIGEIKSIREDTGSAFKEADVLPPYALTDLRQVFVVLK